MIKVSLKGHDFKYEVGELIKVFGLFDSIKFLTEDVDYNTNEFCLINQVDYKDEMYLINTKLIKNGKVISFYKSSYKIDSNIDSIKKRKELKRKIKISIFETLLEIKKADIPWGILTGIRPTKIAHELLDKKYNIDDINKILSTEYKIFDEKIKLVTEVTLCERKYIYPVNEDLVSIYISIPFCPTKCVYCSFPSNQVKEGSNKVQDYLNALHKEIKGINELLNKAGKKVESIYIGGGTPTTLSSLQLDRLINCTLKVFDTSKLKEFTVEAGRPDTINLEKLKTLKNNGVNRISINPQTMNMKTLKLIGRNHTSQDIERAFHEARGVDFKTINMDIIIGLPDEGMNEVASTLERIKKLDPENLTVHTLAIKRSSKLKDTLDDFKMVKEARAEKMLSLTKKYADEMELHPYYMYRQKYMIGNLENIGYCKTGHECIYNMQIMEEKQSIIALGAGGISKIVFPNENRLERVPNVKNVDEYIKRVDEMVDRKRIQFDFK